MPRLLHLPAYGGDPRQWIRTVCYRGLLDYLMLIVRGFTSSDFGIRTKRTPFS